MNISIRLLADTATAPTYQTNGSAAADIRAHLTEPVTLRPGERSVIPTGFAMELPEGYEAQIRARSGLSIKHGICMANGIGTIDSDYRGEVGVILINLGQEAFQVEPGMRIAQMVIARHETAQFTVRESLSETDRGEGGYGSTGH